MGAADTSLARELADDLVEESLAPRGVPERVHYATGVLLGAEDFAAEQLYTRGRMGRAFAALYGFGTLAGLRVRCPANDNPQLEVQVAPGLAMDRLGRLIEIRRTQCIHVTRWLAQREAMGTSAVERLEVIDAVREDVPGATRLVFDVFARFAICPHGRTPAFAAGPFEAAEVPSRLADAFELTLQLAHVVGESDANPKGTLAVPQPRSPKLEAMLAGLQGIADPVALEAARRLWCMESALDAWPEPSQSDPTRLPRLAEHASEADWDKVLLARVSIPVQQDDPGSFPVVDTAAIAAIAASEPPGPDDHREPKWRDLADNGLRPIIFNPYAWRGAL
ncbi:MAG TPA: hypothetical protein VFM98_17815 [Ramlibacter sp.]|uniref:hypothetical protein n=1 Tax=Ramlibacter sp. TaxID=1917967 RepID=UPI002D7FA796|nr:hypothetical protein [Ramlibacter sp.]HET8747462.1 hypothetical protein [Ramlibacter sp.]